MENEIVHTFKEEERIRYGVESYDGNDLMVIISGFDLKFEFNMRVINDTKDAEACADALAQIFYESLVEQLIATKSSVINHVDEENSILNKAELRSNESEPTNEQG